MAGRPTKVTPEVLAKWEQAFAIGCTDIEACSYANVSVDVLYDYQRKNVEFSKRKEQLKQHPILKARQTVARSLEEPEHAKWFLERKKKDEFSLRQEIDQKVDAKIDGTVNVEVWEKFLTNNTEAMEQAKNALRSERQERNKKGSL